MPWLYLASSIVGAGFTLSAYRPSRRWLAAPTFFAAWLTGELAAWHLAWQLVATTVFVWLGALDAWPGWLALAITLASWAGLAGIVVASRRASLTIDAALRAGLGHALAGSAPVRRSRRELVLPLWLRDGRVERIKDVRYAPGGGRRHLLDVYRPRGGAIERAPVLLQIHGGAWIIGDKGQQALPLIVAMAAHGWVCVASNYRLSPRATFPDHLVDCKLALKWVREHISEYGGDPDLVVVTGGSAGGHLAAMLALTTNDPVYQPGFEDVDTAVAACVPFYGVYDFTEIFDTHGRGEAAAEWLAHRVMKTTIARDRAAFEAASPMNYVHADAPPFFVLHGTRDNLVPIAQARRFAAALRATSPQPVLFAEVPGASHAFDVFHSVRTGHAVAGVSRFLEWVRASASSVASGDAAARALGS